MATAQIDLQAFCGEQPHDRYVLDRQFVRGGWRYATDKNIIVRVPANGEHDTICTDRKKTFPPVNWLPWLHTSKELVWQPWPKRHDRFLLPRQTKRRLGGSYVGAEYDDLVRDLPDVEYAKTPFVAADGSRCKAILFRFDGGEGILMPTT